MKVLFTTTRLPAPPFRHGHTVIAYNRIRHLARRHEVTLLSFVQSEEERARAGELAGYCQVHTVLLPKWRALAGGAVRAYRDVPLQVLYFGSAEYQRKLQELAAGNRFDVVHTVLSRGAMHTIHLNGSVKVLEMIDALSLSMQRISETEKFLSRRFFQFEAARMKRFEQLVCSRFDAVVVLSKVDQQQLRASNVAVIPAGADVPEPRTPSNRNRPVVIFSGNLRGWAAHDAMWHLVKDIWPAVQKAIPGVQLRIVGAHPPEKLVQMARTMPDMEVTGYVPDMNRALQEADVAVCPVRTGGAGQHRKALEAMACGVPVVASPRVTGIEGRHGEDFLCAHDVDDYVRAIKDVLTQPALAQKLSTNARRLVTEKYSWEATTRQLELLYEDLLQRRNPIPERAMAYSGVR